jgi:hypothetical protein
MSIIAGDFVPALSTDGLLNRLLRSSRPAGVYDSAAPRLGDRPDMPAAQQLQYTSGMAEVPVRLIADACQGAVQSQLARADYYP